MNKLPLICDTTLLLYLGRVDQAQLLPALFEAVSIPKQVALELDMGRLMRPDTINPRQLEWVTIAHVSQSDIDTLPPNRLGIGEQAVIAYARSNPNCKVGLDDRQARLLAEQMGLSVIGTIGVLLKAKRANLIPAVRPLLDAVRLEGFYLSNDLYQEALRLAGEEV
jgi:predicted nucleic acid-binding protein